MTAEEGRRHRLRKILLAVTVLAIAVLAALALILNPRSAGRAPSSLGERSLVAVGEALFPPFLFEEGGEAKGFDIDLVRELAKRKGLNVDIRLMSWTEAMRAVREGKADFLLGVSDLEERRDYLGFSERMLSMKSYLFVNTDTYAFIRLEDLKDTPVGVQKGDITAQFLAKTHPEIIQKEYPDQAAAIEALGRHEIEAAALDYYSGLLSIQKQKLQSRIKIIGDPLLEAPYCLGVKKGGNEVLFALNDGIEGLKNDGTIRRLQDRWLGTNPISERIWAYALYGLVAALACAAVLLAWNLALRRAVHARTRALAESDELFGLYMEYSPVHMFFKDEALRCLKLSRSYERMLGRPLADMLGRKADELFPPELALSIEAADRRVLEAGGPIELTETVGGRTYRTIRFPIARGGKRRFVAGFAIDETESRRAEQDMIKSLREKETLVRELYHRTKNSLQVIGSLLSLQAAKTPGDQDLRRLVDATKERIQAIALVHQLLFAGHDLSRLSIKEYLERLAASVAEGREAGSRTKLKLAIEDRPCLIDTAIPLGLVINELMVNSLEHAFPAGRAGRITIALGPGEPGRTRLRYSDDGKGLPEGFDFRGRDGLGLSLVFAIVESQLLGKVSMDGAEGMSCVIDFPDEVYVERV